MISRPSDKFIPEVLRGEGGEDKETPPKKNRNKTVMIDRRALTRVGRLRRCSLLRGLGISWLAPFCHMNMDFPN